MTSRAFRGAARSIGRFLALTLVAALGCSPAPAAGPRPIEDAKPATLLKQQRVAMGTQVEITLWAASTASTDAAMDAAYAEMLRLETVMTSWVHPDWPQSDVHQLNAQAGDGNFVEVSPETFAVLALAQEVAQATEGAFDITYAPLRELWHFDEDAQAVVPAADAVARACMLIGYKDLMLHAASSSARLGRSGMRVDLGGIAKGAIVDAAARILRARGIQNFMIQAGGDMYVSGERNGRPWRVGIQDPSRPGEYFASLALTDHAFSTAGDYERAFTVGGKHFHHILDARSGYPATACKSVTVYAPTALLADALDNGIFILGPEAGMALLRNYPGCEAVIVDANNRVWVTPGLKPLLKYR